MRWADVLRRTTGPKVLQVKEGGSATRGSHHSMAKAFWGVTLSLCEVKMSCTHLHLLGTVLVGAHFQGAYRWCSLAKCTSSSGGFVIVAVGVAVVFGDDNFFYKSLPASEILPWKWNTALCSSPPPPALLRGCCHSLHPPMLE